MFGLIIKPASLDLSRGPSVFLHLNAIFFFFSLVQTKVRVPEPSITPGASTTEGLAFAAYIIECLLYSLNFILFCFV